MRIKNKEIRQRRHRKEQRVKEIIKELKVTKGGEKATAKPKAAAKPKAEATEKPKKAAAKPKAKKEEE